MVGVCVLRFGGLFVCLWLVRWCVFLSMVFNGYYVIVVWVVLLFVCVWLVSLIGGL